MDLQRLRRAFQWLADHDRGAALELQQSYPTAPRILDDPDEKLLDWHASDPDEAIDFMTDLRDAIGDTILASLEPEPAAPESQPVFDTERLNRRIVVQVEAPTRQEAEDVADAIDAAMQRILDEGGVLSDWPDARVQFLHDQDTWE